MSQRKINEIFTQKQLEEQYEDLQQLLRIMKKWEVESVEVNLSNDEVKIVFKETLPTAWTFGMSTFFGVRPID